MERVPSVSEGRCPTCCRLAPCRSGPSSLGGSGPLRARFARSRSPARATFGLTRARTGIHCNPRLCGAASAETPWGPPRPWCRGEDRAVQETRPARLRILPRSFAPAAMSSYLGDKRSPFGALRCGTGSRDRAALIRTWGRSSRSAAPDPASSMPVAASNRRRRLARPNTMCQTHRGEGRVGRLLLSFAPRSSWPAPALRLGLPVLHFAAPAWDCEASSTSNRRVRPPNDSA